MDKPQETPDGLTLTFQWVLRILAALDADRMVRDYFEDDIGVTFTIGDEEYEGDDDSPDVKPHLIPIDEALHFLSRNELATVRSESSSYWAADYYTITERGRKFLALPDAMHKHLDNMHEQIKRQIREIDERAQKETAVAHITYHNWIKACLGEDWIKEA